VFELSLPLDRNYQIVEHFSEPRNASEVPDRNLFDGKRVVVVEDDWLVAEGMINLLSGVGAEVLHFHNAEEAFKQKDIATADYFVVDFSLGKDLSGAAFLQTLESRTEKPVKGVIVTGETSSKFIEGIAGLSWPVLHKPINFAKLTAALNS
jgi:DNA-binding response OmpR family regulator